MNIKSINTGLGVATRYFNTNLSKAEKVMPQVMDEFSKRANKPGQFLNWVDLPEQQLKRVDEIYDMAAKLKDQTKSKFLSVFGIGGSKHTVEHMLGINGLNINKNKILFFSDVDSTSMNRFMERLDRNVTNSNYLIASKSGSTFETKDGFLKVKNMLENAYINKGLTKEEAEKQAAKHFIAVTDKNPASSELRRTSDAENWLGKLYIHDDVGGRFSALDDHALFTLAYAGMKKGDMIEMLKGAQKMSKIAQTPDLSVNDPFAQAAFWVTSKLDGIKTSVHQYLGSMFEDTVNWHSQMQNESVKNTLKQIAKVPDAMHHSAEAHFNPANKYAFALTSPIDKGVAKENTAGYIGALEKSYSNAGPFFNETVETSVLGLKPETAGAMTQSRAFSTVYQEMLEKTAKNEPLPEVLDSVLQPHVEVYKKNLKPQPGEPDVVVAGRFSRIA